MISISVMLIASDTPLKIFNDLFLQHCYLKEVALLCPFYRLRTERNDSQIFSVDFFFGFFFGGGAESETPMT